MFASGNMRPQSMSTTVRSGSSAAPCSIAMQLRPISPRPPRKMMRTGTDESVEPGFRRSATGIDQTVVDAAGVVFESVWGRTHRRPALSDGMTERSQHGFRRYRVRGVVTGLEFVALELTGVDAAGGGDVVAFPGVEHLDVIGSAPVGGNPDRPDGTDRQQRQ